MKRVPCSKMFSRNIFIRKNTKSTFSQKMSVFALKFAGFSNFWRVFWYLFLDLEISDNEEHSCQISAQMNNIERFYRVGMGRVVSSSMLLMLNSVKM